MSQPIVTQLEREIVISATFILSSANDFNFNKSKILLFGKQFKSLISQSFYYVQVVTKLPNDCPKVKIIAASQVRN